MGKAFLLVVPSAVILLFAFDFCNALECYHCYQGKKSIGRDATFVPCNEGNMASSNVWTCPSPKAQCVYETVEVQFNKEQQVWRTCSNGISDPCDPSTLPPGVKMIECTYCGTDRCNLQKKGNETPGGYALFAFIQVYCRWTGGPTVSTCRTFFGVKSEPVGGTCKIPSDSIDRIQIGDTTTSV